MKPAILDEVRAKIIVHARPPDVAEVHRAIADAGALLRGHFALQSGAHSDHIFRIRGFARHPDALARLGQLLVRRADVNLDDATLLCPESAGYLFADQLSQTWKRPLAVAKVDLLRRPTRELLPEQRTSRYPGTIVPGTRVVIVNDVASTGGSIATLRELAIERGATVDTVLVLATAQAAKMKKHFQDEGLHGEFLLEGDWSMYPAAVCPQCLGNDRKILPVAEFN